MNTRSIRKYNYKFWPITFIALFSIVPLKASASSTSTQSISALLVSVDNIIDLLLPILASLALLGFFYGLVKYVFNAGNEEGRKEGKQYIIAGIVALFLMASIGGIVSFLVEATGTGTGSIPPPYIDLSN